MFSNYKDEKEIKNKIRGYTLLNGSYISRAVMTYKNFKTSNLIISNKSGSQKLLCEATMASMNSRFLWEIASPKPISQTIIKYLRWSYKDNTLKEVNLFVTET